MRGSKAILGLAKNGIYEGRSAVEQAPGSKIALAYHAIAEQWFEKIRKDGVGHDKFRG